MRRHALRLTGALALIWVLGAGVLPAQSSFGFRDLALGISGPEAGIHPAELTTTLEVETLLDEAEELEFPDGQVQNLEVEMPEGLAGNPTAVPPCPMPLFLDPIDDEGHPACPNASAIGYAAVRTGFDPVPPDIPGYFHVPVYNLTPPPGKAAKIGFTVLSVPVTIEVGLRETPPYNVYARVSNISQAALFYASTLTLWGNPAAESHDSLRGKCLQVEPTGPPEEVLSKGKCPIDITETPFLTAPRSCEGPLVANFFALAWNSGLQASGQAVAPERGSCSKLGFAADTSAQMSSQRAESPSGLAFDLGIEDEGLISPKAEATAFSDIKRTEVIFPEGVTLNPSQAEGLEVCSEAQLESESASSAFGAGCPAASKVGALEVETPLLEGRILKGSLFVATPYENPFGSLIAVYLVIKDPELGIAVKLPGRVYPDPETGQIRTVFGDPTSTIPGYRTLPQVPLSHVRLNLREGARSPLVTPPTCGSYQTKAIFTPWANPEAPYESTSSFQITTGPTGGACPLAKPFAPAFEAGSLNNNAGSYSPFSMRLLRADGEQDMTRFDAVLPPGVVGKIAGVTRCSDLEIAAAAAKSGTEELAAPSCPPNSKIGGVLAGAGVGSQLTYVPGSLYLSGPFGGAPLSVVSIVPAVAGPFDVGTVVTREALNLDPLTAEVRVDGAASDPIPHILAGIPLKLRELRVLTDRTEFTLNPTSCDEESAQATLFGSGTELFSAADDQPVALSDRFQAANCSSLAFKPKLSLKFKGGTKRSGHPAVKATLIPRAGDANIAQITTLLPDSEFIDNAHINNPCTRVQFNAEACPPGSVLGSARAYTPLLDSPLEGPVYFRSNGGERKLPDIVADVRGEGLRFIQIGFVDSRKGRVRTRFLAFPDAPVSRVELSLFGGKRGLLENNRDLCQGKALRLKEALVGQNGKRLDGEPKISTPCGKQAKRQKRRR